MQYRDAVIEYQKTLDDTGTLIKDITLTDPVSALYLEFEATNGATSNKGNFLSDVISKVELVDGSNVLYSLTLAQLESLFWCKTYRMPVMFPSEWASGIQRHGCYLLFGQNLWDTDYSMDFRRYKNPQLKLTTNIAAIRAAGADGFLSGSLKATVVAKVMEGGPSAPHFLCAREIESFVSVASGDKRIELPTDYVYRLCLLRLWKQQSDIDEIVSDLKLTCDTDKFVPIQRKVKQLDAEMFAEYGLGRLKHDIFTKHQAAFRLVFNKEPFYTPLSWEDATPEIIGDRYFWSSEGKLDITDNAGTAITSDMKISGMEEGHAIHATLPIWFGQLYWPETWFNPKTFKLIEFVLTQKVADAACSVLLEQVRPSGS